MVLMIDEEVRVKKVTNVAYALGRMNMSSKERYLGQLHNSDYCQNKKCRWSNELQDDIEIWPWLESKVGLWSARLFML